MESREEILKQEFLKFIPQKQGDKKMTSDEFDEAIKKDRRVFDLMLNAMQEYSDQQSKTLLEEIERLKGEVKAAEWISVDVEPKGGNSILVNFINSNNENQIKEAYYHKGIKNYYIRSTDSNEEDILITKPTHWMPLPKKPKTN